MADENNANGTPPDQGGSGADQGQNQNANQNADAGGQSNAAENSQAGDKSAGDTGQTGGQKDAQTKGYWPEDWRKNMAGGDDKLLKQLERYQSPADIYKKARELERKLSSGEAKKGPAADASPEEIAAWRKEQGIPETPEAYALPEGFDISEADKPKVNEFFKAAHSLNLPVDAAKAILAHYAKVEMEAQAAREQQDAEVRDRTKEELIQEWGLNDYRKNVSMVRSTFLGMLPEEERTLLENARLADGTPLFSHPGILRGLTGFVREINPAATVVPNSSAPLTDINGKIAEYQKMMKDTRGPYYKGPESSKHQAEYRRLIEARDKLQKRA